jgi:hypothetical protein
MIQLQYGKEKIIVEDSDQIASTDFSETVDRNVILTTNTENGTHLKCNFQLTTLLQLKEELVTLVNHYHRNQLNGNNVGKELSSESHLVDPTEVKLIFNGKVLSNNDETLKKLVVPPLSSSSSSSQSKIIKIMIIANPLTKETQQKLLEEKQHQREIKEKLKKRRKFLHKSNSSGNADRRKGPIIYGFHRITTLSNLPNEQKAKEILQSLANDSGIIAVMNKYKFTVNELCEMYPEGNVGIDDVCIMGLNQNHGQKILLRLRTDDLKGFRKYLSIKKVLYHELAHNQFSEHDNNFFMLMRQIEIDANNLKWEYSKAHKTGGSRSSSGGGEGGGMEREYFFSDDDEDEDDTERRRNKQTVFTLGGGGDSDGGSNLPATRIAGEAAILRFHQFQNQQKQQQYNQYEKTSGTNDDDEDGGNEGVFIEKRHSVDGKEQFKEEGEEQQQQEERKSEDDSSDHSDSSVSDRKAAQSMEVVNAEQSSSNEAEHIINDDMIVVDYISSQDLSPGAQQGKNESERLEELMIVDNIMVDSSSSFTLKNEDQATTTEHEKTEEESLPTKLIKKQQQIDVLFEDSISMILSDETLISTVEKVFAIKDIISAILSSKVRNAIQYQQFIEMLKLFITVINNIQVSLLHCCLLSISFFSYCLAAFCSLLLVLLLYRIIH